MVEQQWEKAHAPSPSSRSPTDPPPPLGAPSDTALQKSSGQNLPSASCAGRRRGGTCQLGDPLSSSVMGTGAGGLQAQSVLGVQRHGLVKRRKRRRGLMGSQSTGLEGKRPPPVPPVSGPPGLGACRLGPTSPQARLTALGSRRYCRLVSGRFSLQVGEPSGVTSSQASPGAGGRQGCGLSKYATRSLPFLTGPGTRPFPRVSRQEVGAEARVSAWR